MPHAVSDDMDECRYEHGIQTFDTANVRVNSTIERCRAEDFDVGLLQRPVRDYPRQCHQEAGSSQGGDRSYDQGI